MNVYAHIFCFFSIGISTTYCMQQLPNRFRDLDWKQDVRNLKKSTFLSEKKYEDTLDNILEYAVDEYEQKKGTKLSPESRDIVKVIQLRSALGYSLSHSQ